MSGAILYVDTSKVRDGERIDVYGRVSETAVKQLQQKADMLGHATLTIHDLHAEFTRLAERTTQIG